MKKILSWLLLCVLVLVMAEAALQCVPLFLNKRSHSSGMSARKILCLGDSFTYGSGAEANSSYPSQLEYLLNANNRPEKFRVTNLAALGVSSSMVANGLEGYLKKYDPDIVIVLAGANDHWNIKDSNVLEVKNGPRTGPGRFFMRLNMFLYNFRTYRLLQLALYKISRRVQKSPERSVETIPLSNIDDPRLVQDLVEFNYGKMSRIPGLSLRKTELFFQTYPDFPKHVNRAIRKAAQDHSVPLIDQESLFPKADRLAEFLSSDGWHLNAKGYNLMAVHIYNDFLRRGIVKNKPDLNYHPPAPQTFPDEIIPLAGSWKFNLSSIARHPEKLINLRNSGWYFHANNTVDLPALELGPGTYELVITAHGTPVDRVYPRVGFYYRSAECADCPKEDLGKIHVNERTGDFSSGPLKIAVKQKIIFYVSFENDEFRKSPEKTEDRNLFISQIMLKPSKK